jgi:general secretion pathway protein G
LAALIQQPPNTPNWHGPYIEVTNAAALKDPWGNAFVYAYPGAINKGGFDLTSAGPDGKPGSADDIGNPKEPK